MLLLERAPVPHETSLACGRRRRETRDASPPLLRCGGGTRASRRAPHGETVPRPTRRGRCGHKAGLHDRRPPRHRRPSAVRPPPPGVLAARAAERREEQTSVAPVRANYAPAAAAGPGATLRASVCVTCPRRCVCFWPRGARAGAVGLPGRPSSTPPERETGGCGSAHAPPGSPRCAQRVWLATAGGARTWGGRKGCVCDAYRLVTTHHPSPIRRTFNRYRLSPLYEAAKRQAQRSATTPGRAQPRATAAAGRGTTPFSTAVHSWKINGGASSLPTPASPLLNPRRRPTGGGGRGRKRTALVGIAGHAPPGAPYTSRAHWSSLPARRCAAPAQRAPRAATQSAMAAAPTQRARQNGGRSPPLGVWPTWAGEKRCPWRVHRSLCSPTFPFPCPPHSTSPPPRCPRRSLGQGGHDGAGAHAPPPSPPPPATPTAAAPIGFDGGGKTSGGPHPPWGSSSSTKSAVRARRGGRGERTPAEAGGGGGASPFSVPRRRKSGAGRGGSAGRDRLARRAGWSASPRPPARPGRPAPVRSLPAVPLGANRGGSGAWSRLVGVAVPPPPVAMLYPRPRSVQTGSGLGQRHHWWRRSWWAWSGRGRPAPPPGVQSGGRR